jgi:hypothetical protein
LNNLKLKASANNYQQIAKALINAGASLNLQDNNGRTALIAGKLRRR